MYKKYIISIIFICLSFLFLTSCAGSREEGEEVLTEDEKQQKELDDIEALLGISTDKSQPAAETAKPAANEEKLNLLDTNEIIDNSQTTKSKEPSKEAQTKIVLLEEQLRQKERAIDYLNEQLALKDKELSKKQSTPAASMPLARAGDVSMEEYQSRYDDARREFESRNYQSAATLFESMLAASSQHSLSDNAQYWIGECHYALRQYDKAIIDFEKVFTFANSNKQDDAQYKLGLCYIRMGDKAKAQEELNTLIRNYPNSEYAPKAEKLLAN